MFERLHKSQLGIQADETAKALRWRTAILKLSENFREAADVRQDLSLVLMEALHNALENLLLLGDEADLLALEEWLDAENAARDQSNSQTVGAAESTTPMNSFSAGDSHCTNNV